MTSPKAPPMTDEPRPVKLARELLASERDKSIWSAGTWILAQQRARDIVEAFDLGVQAGLAAAPRAGVVERYAERIKEVLAEGDGIWRTCSGCYETEDGQNVHGYPHSKVFGDILGGGCGECGGLGVIWDSTDYGKMADFMARDLAAPPAVPDPHAELVAAAIKEQNNG